MVSKGSREFLEDSSITEDLPVRCFNNASRLDPKAITVRRLLIERLLQNTAPTGCTRTFKDVDVWTYRQNPSAIIITALMTISWLSQTKRPRSEVRRGNVLTKLIVLGRVKYNGGICRKWLYTGWPYFTRSLDSSKKAVFRFRKATREGNRKHLSELVCVFLFFSEYKAGGAAANYEHDTHARTETHMPHKHNECAPAFWCVLAGRSVIGRGGTSRATAAESGR